MSNDTDRSDLTSAVLDQNTAPKNGLNQGIVYMEERVNWRVDKLREDLPANSTSAVKDTSKKAMEIGVIVLSCVLAFVSLALVIVSLMFRSDAVFIVVAAILAFVAACFALATAMILPVPFKGKEILWPISLLAIVSIALIALGFVATLLWGGASLSPGTVIDTHVQNKTVITNNTYAWGTNIVPAGFIFGVGCLTLILINVVVDLTLIKAKRSF